MPTCSSNVLGYKVIGEDGGVKTEREDFKFTTGNKQLNFLQHI